MTRALSKEQYDQAWMARVKARCTVNEKGCWLWPRGHREKWGYGQTNYRSRTVPVHRQMYKVFHQVELKKEQYVCHSCDETLCCNPEHLWVGSNRDNMQDCARKGRADGQWKTHCKRGHEFNEENTRRYPSTGRRNCVICQRIRQRIKAGWSKEQAESVEVVQHGKRPVGASWKHLRK